MRTFVVTSVVAAMLVAAAVPAGATDHIARLADDAGDVNEPAGDATGIRVTHDHNTIKVSMKLVGWTDPSTSPNWAYGMATNATWFLETRGNAEVDYAVVVQMASSAEFGGKVLRATSSGFIPVEGCETWATAREANHTLSYRFPRSCVGGPERVRIAGRMTFEKDPEKPGTRVQIDMIKRLGGANPWSSWANRAM